MNSTEIIMQKIEQCKYDAIFLYNYSRDSNSLSRFYNVKLTKTISDGITEYAKDILSTEQGIELFAELLRDKNFVVANMASYFLYPLYPKCSLRAMNKYIKRCDSVQKIIMQTYLEGQMRQDKFFVEMYEKIYGKERYHLLKKI